MLNNFQDFTIPNGLGLRVSSGYCQVIRLQRGKWNEIGRAFDLPLRNEDLDWAGSGNPLSLIAVALRAYELSNPASSLRRQLTEPMRLRAAS
jgi:hypothetical protein